MSLRPKKIKRRETKTHKRKPSGMKSNWTKTQDGLWRHNSGKYFMSFYNAREWYGELQDEDRNTLGLVAYTRHKAAGLKACTQARKALNTVEVIEKFVREKTLYPRDWNVIAEEAH